MTIAQRRPPGEAEVVLRTMHDGQRSVRAALMTNDGVLVRCGRRWGKSVNGEDTGIEVAAGLLLPPNADGSPRFGRVGWFSPNSDYSLPVWESVKQRLAPLIKRVSEQEAAIWLHGSPFDAPNFEFWTCHNNAHPGRSRDYDLAIFDEAGLIPDLDRIWAQDVQPTLAITRGKSLWYGTPLGRRTPFNARFDAIRAGQVPRWVAIQRSSTDNPLVPPAYVEEQRQLAAAHSARALAAHMQEYHGEPMDDGSNPIGLAHIGAAVSARSSEPVVCWGIDLAKSVDWTVVVGLDIYGRWAYCERWQEDWPVTKQRLLRILRGGECAVADGAFAFVDKTGVGSPIVSDLQLQLDHVVGKTFTASYRRAIIQRLVVSLPQRRFTIPDGWLRHELETLGAEEQASGVQYSVPDGLHDDGIMALALACHAFEGVGIPTDTAVQTQYDRDNRSTLRVRREPPPRHDWQTTVAWTTDQEEVEV